MEETKDRKENEIRRSKVGCKKLKAGRATSHSEGRKVGFLQGRRRGAARGASIETSLGESAMAFVGRLSSCF
jgi:hypothetical protein